VARREGHSRRRGGEIWRRCARLEADGDPAALHHREPRLQILKLAGVADGALVRELATPPGIEYAKQHIRLGLAASNRDWRDIRLCSWIYLSLLERADDPVPESVKRGVSFAFWSSRKALSAMVGQLAPDASDAFRTFIREAPHEWSPPIMDELRRLMPRRVIDSLAWSAAPPVVAGCSLAAAGVEEIVICRFRASARTWTISCASSRGRAAARGGSGHARGVAADRNAGATHPDFVTLHQGYELTGAMAITLTPIPDIPLVRRATIAARIIAACEGARSRRPPATSWWWRRRSSPRRKDATSISPGEAVGARRGLAAEVGRTRVWSKSFSNRGAWCATAPAC
jgi:hypothetical protein